jgi:FAD/FMN-containing dehydrogenase
MTDTEPSTGPRMVRRGDDDYEALRRAAVWNERKPERHPDVIVVARDEEDVVAAVRYAAEHELHIGIRSGGHSWVGNGVRDGGMLLDLSTLQDIEVDAAAARASVGPAAKGPAVYEAVSAHGLFFPTGHAPTVGIGGFIIGGGYGWNSRYLGPACLSIEAVDLVLADGTLVHADDETYPDLMWAVRGAGPGFFGAVTRLHLRLSPHPKRILRTVHAYPLELRDEVLAFAYDALEHLPREVEISAKVGYTPGREDFLVSVTATAFCTEGTVEDPLAHLETAIRRTTSGWRTGPTSRSSGSRRIPGASSSPTTTSPTGGTTGCDRSRRPGWSASARSTTHGGRFNTYMRPEESTTAFARARR